MRSEAKPLKDGIAETFGYPKNTSRSSKPETKDDASVVMKRPAGKPGDMSKPENMMKKPSAAQGAGLKEDELAKMAEMEDKQNESINKAMENALTQVRKKELGIMEFEALLQGMACAGGRESQLRDIYIADVKKYLE